MTTSRIRAKSRISLHVEGVSGDSPVGGAGLAWLFDIVNQSAGHAASAEPRPWNGWQRRGPVRLRSSVPKLEWTPELRQ